MKRSDMWRGQRYGDLVREVAYVTRGIGDYFGAACGTREYRVKWEAQSEAAGATDIRSKVVKFRSALLNGKSAPFDSGFVDELTGIAAHEAGHVSIHAECGGEFVAGDSLDHLARNVIEDLAIDGQPMAATNEGLGELTRLLRTESDWSAENRKRITEHWQSDQPLNAEALLRLWACSLLFRCEAALAPRKGRERERAYIDRLNPIGLAVRESRDSFTSYGFGNNLAQATYNVIAIIREAAQSDPPAPAQSPEDGEDGSDQDESGQSGQSGASSGEDENESEESESKSKSESGKAGDSSESESSGHGGSGAGKARKGKLPPLPEVEPNAGDTGEAPDPTLDKAFWQEVSAEAERLEIQAFLNHGSVNVTQELKPYTDPRIVSAIRAAYNALASEPARMHRQDSGRLDRRQLPFIRERQDCFTRDKDRTLKGTLALVLDLSGSTSHVQDLIKRIAASVYLALRSTDIKCYVYGYGDPAVYQIATPTKVVPFDSFRADGGTPTASAIRAVVRDVKPNGQSIMIHVTDGQPAGMTAAQNAMVGAKAAGWILVNIGVSVSNIGGIYPMSDHAEDISRYEDLPAIIREAVKSIAKSGRARIK